jgi:hypothetical protein
MQPTAEPHVPAAAPRTTIRARIAARLPEILIEALFLLIAVVLAFAVEEWREERELDRIAEEARSAIVQELEHNHDELLESRQDITDAIAALETALAAPEPSAQALRDVSGDFEIALLSTAAWRSAQSMEAARRMDHTWMLTVARAYEFQALYEQAQWAALDANLTFMAARDEADRPEIARRLLARIRFLASLGRGLEGDYDDILAETTSTAASSSASGATDKKP